MKTRNHDFSQPVLARVAQWVLLTVLAAPGLAAAQASPGAPAAPDAAAQKEVITQQKADQNAAWAMAANGEGDVHHLICPENYFELGVLGVSRSETKFGEYNGLEKSGAHALGNFDVSGGNGYCAQGGTMRWNVFGKDLGTTSRSLGASAYNQGKWNVGIGFDQMRHYTTTGYQTPYQGLGSNNLTLDPAFGVVNVSNTSTTLTPGYLQTPLTPAQLAAMRTYNVYNQRANTTFTAGYSFNTEWNLKFDYKHIDMTGGKLIGSGSDTTGNITAGGLTNNFTNQAISLLLNPTKSTTDNFTLSGNWVGKNAYASLEYYGSIYKDAYNGLTWSTPFTTGVAPAPVTGSSPGSVFPTNSMSTPPSNSFHQLSLTGGYFISPATRLTGGLSFGINRQNESYDGTYTAGKAIMPAGVNSLNGKVNTRHADLRLTHQFTPALNLNVGLRYNERDNNTPVYTYQFSQLNQATGTTSTVTNAPQSNRTENVDATLAYRIDKKQKVSAGYAYDYIKRWCSSDLANNAQGVATGVNVGYYTTASCAQVPKSGESRFTLNYRRAAWDSVDLNVSYTYADRKATVNPSFYNPMQAAANSQGFENYGWRAFFQGSRREDLLSARVGWQVNSKLNLGLSGKYANDSYYDSALGVQGGKWSNLNLDANYAVTDDISFGFYVGWEDRSRDLTANSQRASTAAGVAGLAVPWNTTMWWNSLSDRNTMVGINGRQKFMHGRLELMEDLSWSDGRTQYTSTVGTGITGAAAVNGSGSTPPITSQILQFRLSGSYKVDRHSSIGGGWQIQRLKSNDYFYNGYQYGYAPTSLLPTNQQAPSYTVNTLYLLYRYTF